jgi:hypothetical protein
MKKQIWYQSLLFLQLILGPLLVQEGQAQVRDGVYGGLAPGNPQTGFIKKRGARLLEPNFITLMTCNFSSGRSETIALDINEFDGRKRIAVRSDGTFRKAFQWTASDGTEKTAVIKGRASGENRMRIRVDAFAEYSDPDPDVDMLCSGVSVYRMRYLYGG